MVVDDNVVRVKIVSGEIAAVGWKICFFPQHYTKQCFISQGFTVPTPQLFISSQLTSLIVIWGLRMPTERCSFFAKSGNVNLVKKMVALGPLSVHI